LQFEARTSSRGIAAGKTSGRSQFFNSRGFLLMAIDLHRRKPPIVKVDEVQIGKNDFQF
jgi:hypothetical protein